MQKQEVLAEFKMGLGGIVISIAAADSNALFTVDSTRKRFSATGQTDIILRTHCSDVLPSRQCKETIFASDGLWSLFGNEGKYILCCKPDPTEAPDRIVVISPDFRSGDIYINMQKIGFDFSYGYPLEYPLDEILTISLLSLGRGMMAHACGLRDKRKGMLFVGESGAGKSTLCNLWKDKKDVTVLSDDRIIIRKMGGRFWMYGTPWHGDAKVCSPERVPLEKIFFLKHAKMNKVKRIEGIDAASKLLVCSFPTFWDKKGMEFTLGFIDKLVGEVPCYKLEFVPNKTAIDFVKNI